MFNLQQRYNIHFKVYEWSQFIFSRKANIFACVWLTLTVLEEERTAFLNQLNCPRIQFVASHIPLHPSLEIYSQMLMPCNITSILLSCYVIHNNILPELSSESDGASLLSQLELDLSDSPDSCSISSPSLSSRSSLMPCMLSNFSLHKWRYNITQVIVNTIHTLHKYTCHYEQLKNYKVLMEQLQDTITTVLVMLLLHISIYAGQKPVT